jgi:hypothetical protein
VNFTAMLLQSAKVRTREPKQSFYEGGERANRESAEAFRERMKEALLNRRLTTKQVAEVVGFAHRASASNALWRLQKQGYVKKVGHVKEPGTPMAIWTWGLK